MATGKSMRWIKAAAASCLSNSLAQRAAFRLHRTKTLFLMYHGIAHDAEEIESSTIVREGAFRRQMEYLKENFDCLSIEEALDRTGHQAKRLGVVVTFDDGYQNNLKIALPILEEGGIPAIIYVTTGNVCERQLFWSDKIWIAARRSALARIDLTGISNGFGEYSFLGTGEQWQDCVKRLTEDIKRTDPSRREEIAEEVLIRFRESPQAKPFDINVEDNVFTPLTADQVSALTAHPLITIGSHSHCHNLLNQIPLRQAEESIRKSKEILEQLTGKRVEHFSYPNGNLTPDIVTLLKDAGFKSAVSIPPGFFKYGDDPYFIKRIMVGPYTTLDMFKARLTGVLELASKLS